MNDPLQIISPTKNKRLVFLAIISAVFELSTLAIVGFLLSGADEYYWLVKYVIEILKLSEYIEVAEFIIIGLVLISIIFSGVIRFVFFVRLTNRAHDLNIELNAKILSKFMNLKTEKINEKSKEKYLKLITNSTNMLVYSHFFPSHSLIVQCSTLFLVMSYSIYQFPEAAISILTLVTIVYFALWRFNRSKLNLVAEKINENLSSVISGVVSLLKGVRYIKLKNLEASVMDAHLACDSELKKNMASAQIIHGSPKYYLETLVYLIIVAGAIFSSLNPDIFPTEDIILFGLISLKAIPNLQGIYASMVSIRSAKSVYRETSSMIDELEVYQEFITNNLDEIDKSLAIGNSFAIKKFHVSRDEFTLSADEISFRKGEVIALTGASGSGKSTFFDILCGLSAMSSEVEIISTSEKATKSFSLNKRLWRQHVELMEQVPFFKTGRVQESMFGTSESDHDFMLLKKLNLIGSEKNIGELLNSDIHMFSGGELQRLGLYRSLMQSCDLLLLDEPTSALDEQNKINVMDILKSIKDKTIIVITHDREFVKNCDREIKIIYNKLLECTMDDTGRDDGK